MTQSTEQRRLLRLADSYNRKAARLGVPGTVKAFELYQLPHQCAYCGIGLEDGHGTFDHARAFARGGTNEISNIVRCCLECNRVKFDKSPEELAQYRTLEVICPVDGTKFRPRWGEWKAGRGRVCSLSCAAKLRWMTTTTKAST